MGPARWRHTLLKARNTPCLSRTTITGSPATSAVKKLSGSAMVRLTPSTSPHAWLSVPTSCQVRKKMRVFSISRMAGAVENFDASVCAHSICSFTSSCSGLVFMLSAALKFSGFLPRPTLDDYFRFGVELHGVAPLSMQNAEETIFPSAKWEVRHRRGYANVDADIPSRRFVAKFSRGRATGGKKRGLVAIGTVVQKFHGVVYGVRVHQAQYRPKNFCMR